MLINPTPPTQSRAVLAAALSQSRAALVGVGVMSGMINVLALTGSLYMLQVYDRVLNARSVPTLVGLTVLMLAAYSVLGILDALRTRIMGRIGMRLDRLLRAPVFAAVMLAPLRSYTQSDGLLPIRDLDQMRTVLSGPGVLALFDAPWLPFYLALVYLLHPWLGLLAMAGAFILILLTWLTEWRSRAPMRAMSESATARFSFVEAARRNAEVAHACGLGPALGRRWSRASETYLNDSVGGAERVSGFVSGSRVFRMALQSCMLGLGAFLVLKGEASGGIIIAASILGARALAPVEMAIAHWRSMVAARQSYQRLEKLLSTSPDDADRMDLPAPRASLEAQAVTVAAPGTQRVILHNVSFKLEAGDGLGIIGQSATGKSTLVRALVGAWQPLRGAVCLDGSALDQWRTTSLGHHIGYLPQDVEIFDATIAENIGKLEDLPESAKVIAAAKAAGIDRMITALPGGYNTRVGRGGSLLSAGQRQRIGLARALFAEPFLVVLDEPNSNLDSEGDAALTAAIAAVRSRGGIVVVVAHRPSAVAALNKILVLADGMVKDVGPKEEVLARVMQIAPPRAESSTVDPNLGSAATLGSVHPLPSPNQRKGLIG